VGPRTHLYGVKRREIIPYSDANSDPSAVRPVASHYELYSYIEDKRDFRNRICVTPTDG
jgi:hypothetical protein